VLERAGYEYIRPKGAFYLWVKSPIPDEVDFCGRLKQERVLAVPGSGFGCPGYFRLSFCVDESIIEASFPSFKAAMDTV
jgi:aspartate aminotransferase